MWSISKSCESCFPFQASDQGTPGDKNQKTKQNEEDSGEPAAKRPHVDGEKNVSTATQAASTAQVPASAKHTHDRLALD